MEAAEPYWRALGTHGGAHGDTGKGCLEGPEGLRGTCGGCRDAVPAQQRPGGVSHEGLG